jgi:hypothetical protein
MQWIYRPGEASKKTLLDLREHQVPVDDGMYQVILRQALSYHCRCKGMSDPLSTPVILLYHLIWYLISNCLMTSGMNRWKYGIYLEGSARIEPVGMLRSPFGSTSWNQSNFLQCSFAKWLEHPLVSICWKIMFNQCLLLVSGLKR